MLFWHEGGGEIYTLPRLKTEVLVVFARVKRVIVKIANGRRERDWLLGVFAKRYRKRFSASPQGKKKIVIESKKGKELFFSFEPGVGGIVPIVRAGEKGENFGLCGFFPKTGEPLNVAIERVVDI